jgi:ABC-type nitrate/sulfonate/bicarbonate transport system substrate-binding protein
VRVMLTLVVALPVACAGFVTACGGPGSSPDKVTLQLNWYHEAEFVGYYVAAEKGFYAAQNLDVAILPRLHHAVQSGRSVG